MYGMWRGLRHAIKLQKLLCNKRGSRRPAPSRAQGEAMSYWYIAHDDELLIDIDEYTRPTKQGAPWGEMFFRRRLRDAILDHKLFVSAVYLDRSNSEHHFQIIVK